MTPVPLNRPASRPEGADMTGFDPQDLLGAMGHAVIATDVAGLVVAWNPAAERMYGWTAQEAVGRDIADLTVPEMDQRTAAAIMAALRAGTPWSGSFPVRRKDGGIFPALVTDSGIYKAGELVGIVGVSTHIGQAINPLLDRSSDAALILRSDAVVTYASPAASQLFGWDVDEIVGASVIPLLHPEDLARLAEFLGEVGTVGGAHPPIEVRVQARGDWVTAEATLTNLLDHPSVRGFVCNLRLSVWREAHERAQEKVAQLQNALDTRVVVEQAKGYLMARTGISLEDAFQALRSQARRQRRTVRELAGSVLAGELLGEPPERSGG
jgi:PAS domain S-box-containing protein